MLTPVNAIFVALAAIAIYCAYRSIYSVLDAPPRITHAIVIIILFLSLLFSAATLAAEREAPQPFRITSYTFDHFYEEFNCYKFFYAPYKALTYCTSEAI